MTYFVKLISERQEADFQKSTSDFLNRLEDEDARVVDIDTFSKQNDYCASIVYSNGHEVE